jgi:inorganic pyrophosphatase
MYNCWRNFSAGPDPPNEIYAIVEVPRGSRNKYEYDCDTGLFYLDRVLYSSLCYPADYGLIPRTWWPDEDPLDILILTSNPTFSGCILLARPLGMLITEDEAGKDEKILSVPTSDPRFSELMNLKDVASHTLLEIEDFFQNYKKLEPGKWVDVKEWKDKKAAQEVIMSAITLYKKKFEISEST